MSKAILVVDDDQGFAQALGEALTESGYTVYLAHDAATALSYAETVKPALILSDIQMPGFGNGADAARAMRAVPGLKGTPIIFLSGLAESSAQRLISGISGARFIQKPPELLQVVSAVKDSVGEP